MKLLRLFLFCLGVAIIPEISFAQCLSGRDAIAADLAADKLAAPHTLYVDVNAPAADVHSMLLDKSELGTLLQQSGQQRIALLDGANGSLLGMTTPAMLGSKTGGLALTSQNGFGTAGPHVAIADHGNSVLLPASGIAGLSSELTTFGILKYLTEQVVGDSDGRTAHPWPVLANNNRGAMVPPQPVAANNGVAPQETDDAVVTISADMGIGPPLLCNGVQIGRGLILTNRHCVNPADSASQWKRYYVYFGELSRRTSQQMTHLYPGNVDFTGDFRCLATPVAEPRDFGRTLDFALLNIADIGPAVSRVHIAKLDQGQDYQDMIADPADRGVRMVQTGLFKCDNPDSCITVDPHYLKRYQQAYDPHAKDTCQILDPAANEPPDGMGSCTGSDSAYSSAGVEHTCDSQQGTSGAPLFDLRNGDIVALHRGSDSQVTPDGQITPNNCAVPAAWIYRSLKRWQVQANCTMADKISGTCH